MKLMKLFVITGITVFSMATLSFALDADQLNALIEQEKNDLNKMYNACHSDSEMIRKASISFNADLREINQDQKCMVVQLDDNEISDLREWGFEIAPATEWIEKQTIYLDQLNRNPLKDLTTNDGVILTDDEDSTSEPAAHGIEKIPEYNCYETVQGTFDTAQHIAETYPNLAAWFDIGDSWEKINGLGGSDLMVLKLTNAAISGVKPVLFINSAIHAREYATAPLALNFARYLTSNYGADADATWILDYHEVHFLLVTNPDGRKLAEAGLSWRKNTNQAYCGPESNKRGVDLNRNFSFTWNEGGGSSDDECDKNYRGPHASSEPETHAMETYVRSIFEDRRGPGPDAAAPDTTSGLHLDIHSFGKMVLWPWATTSDPAPNGAQLQTLGRKFAYWNGYSPKQAIGLYPMDGTTQGLTYGELGVPSYIFELGTRYFQNCDSFTETIVPDNMPALIYAAKIVRTPYITPSGPNVDEVTLSSSIVRPGTPVTLSATVSDARFDDSNGAEPIQAINAAEYYIDTPPWLEGAIPAAMTADDSDFDNPTEKVSATIDTTGWDQGRHIIFVRGRDAETVWGAFSAIFLTIGDEISQPEYCAAQSENASYAWIAGLNVGALNLTSDASSYSDVTSTVTDLAQGLQSVTITPGFRFFQLSNHYKIFIDLNQDYMFETGEELFSATGSSPVTGKLTIPQTASLGETRMRVVMRYDKAPEPCGSFEYGEVEDYTVNIVEGSVTPIRFYYENTTTAVIPDRAAVSSTIIVPEDASPVDRVTISVTTTHADLGDLSIIVSKADHSVTVKTRRYFDDSNGTETYTASVTSTDINDFTGTWTATVTDNFRGNTGTLDSWRISNE